MTVFKQYDHFIDKRGLLFNVKGSRHREARVRSSLVYIPMNFDTGKKSVDSGIFYARLIDDIGDVFCAKNVKDIYYQDPITSDSFIAVPIADIKQYFSVLENRERVMKMFKNSHPVFVVLKKLMSLGIPTEELGFFGSALTGLFYSNKKLDLMSDVDIIIYGKKNYTRWLQVCETELHNWLIWPGMSRTRYRDFAGNFPFSFKEALKQFGVRRCPYTLLVDGVIFHIRFGYTDGEAPQEERYSPVAEIKTLGIIVENEDSAFCPACYVIKTLNDEHIRVITYRNHYRHLFEKGEQVEVFGMLTSNPTKTITLENYEYYIKGD